MAKGDLQPEIFYPSLMFTQLFIIPVFFYAQWHIPIISSTYEAKAGIDLNAGDLDKFGDVAGTVSLTRVFPFHDIPLGYKLSFDTLRFHLTVRSLYLLSLISFSFQSSIICFVAKCHGESSHEI